MGFVRQRDIREKERELKHTSDPDKCEKLEEELRKMRAEYAEYEQVFSELR